MNRELPGTSGQSSERRRSHDPEAVDIADLAGLRRWLETHHATSPGVWVVTGKKGATGYIAYPDIVREALRVGWIDSRPRAVDEHRTSRLLTPRKPGSGWSRVNKGHVTALEQAGDMHPAGQALVDQARADGSWTALDAVEELTEPPDLAAALRASPQARAQWDEFPRSAKRAFLEWITQARTPPTRERRVRETVDQAAAGRRANQWRQRKDTGTTSSA